MVLSCSFDFVSRDDPGIYTLEFADVRQGMVVRVDRIRRDSIDTQRLMEMGLTPGAEVHVRKVAPLGDPIEIEVRGSRLCIRRSESAGIELSLAAKEAG